MDKSAQTKDIIQHLYPFHPYTAYLATFVSRAIGSAERSIFEFLNDENKGFKHFIQQDIDDVKYLTADKVWDFFVKAFSEDRTNNFDAIIYKFSMYSTKLEDTDVPELSAFKVILLLNLLNRVTQMDGADQEKSLVNPSKKNILHVLSGEWSSDAITRALDSIDEKQIVLKGPDEVYEVSSSAMPMEKIQAAKDKLYLKYEDVSSLLDEYIGYRNDITKAISNADGFNRITEFSLVWGSLSAISMESKLLKAFSKDYAAKIAIIVFRGDTPTYDKKSNRPEATLENQKNLIQALSQRETMKDIVFVIADTTLGQQRFEGVIEAKARETVAKDTKVEDDSFYLLTLAAVAKELKKRGLSDAKVFLAVGLPLTRFGAERNNFIKYLTKNKRVDFRYENEAYHIEIDDVAVFPQCYAAVVDKIPTMAKKTLVVDIGSWTIDIMPVINKSPDESKCVTVPRGLITCMRSINEQCVRQLNGEVDETEIQNIMRYGRSDIDDEYLAIIKAEIEDFVEKVYNSIREF